MGSACRFKSKKKAFANYTKKYTDGRKGIEAELEQLKKHCSVIRVLAHTQIRAINYGQKKAHMSEIQAPPPPPPLSSYAQIRLVHGKAYLCYMYWQYSGT